MFYKSLPSLMISHPHEQHFLVWMGSAQLNRAAQTREFTRISSCHMRTQQLC